MSSLTVLVVMAASPSNSVTQQQLAEERTDSTQSTVVPAPRLCILRIMRSFLRTLRLSAHPSTHSRILRILRILHS